MKYFKAQLTKKIIDYFEEDFRRIEHALDVLKEAELLLTSYSWYDYDIVLSTSLLHDIGIKRSEELLGYNTGQTQEKFGPPVAEEILLSLNIDKKKIDKICEIIGNHHSKSKYDYVELEILKKADRIVNARG